MHLFGRICDHDYYFRLLYLPEEEALSDLLINPRATPTVVLQESN
jgi:hypothetical protein